jgi:hypothetical protein
MEDKNSSAKLRPLFIGRVTRVVFGIGTLVLIPVIGSSTLTTVGTIGLAALGLSFLVGGIAGNPGCELTAIPNLLVPKQKRCHCL